MTSIMEHCDDCQVIFESRPDAMKVPVYDDDGSVMRYICTSCDAKYDREEAEQKARAEADDKKAREVDVIQERTCDQCHISYLGRAYQCRGTCHGYCCESCMKVDDFRYCYRCYQMYGRGP